MHGLDQAGGVREPLVFGLQLVPFLGPECERFEFLRLPVELLALGCQCLRVGFQRASVPADVLPRAKRLRDLHGQFSRTGIAIEQLALRRRAQQRLVLVLAVDIDQVFADILELLQGRGPAVDERARAARRFDDPAQQAFAVVAREIVVRAGRPSTRECFVGRELGADFGFVRAFAHQSGSARSPSTAASASIRIDLPAPVSPVSTVKPGWNSRSSRSTMTKSRMLRAAQHGRLREKLGRR